MRTNPWSRWEALEPQPTRMIGAILEHGADGTSLVEIIGGGQVRARGTGVAVGHLAFVRDGEIEGEAPELPLALIEV